MNQRQERLLRRIVVGYISTAQPIASKSVADSSKLNISPATVRNEMAELERESYICQPHTSAGRVPTMKGYRYYIDHLLEADNVSKKEEEQFRSIFSQTGLKGIARQSSHYTHSAAIIMQNNSDFYYTGFSELFHHPEFEDSDIVQAISQAVDHIEDNIDNFLHDDISHKPKIYLGKNNPLGNHCSVMMVANNKKNKVIFGLLSPVRTDYARNIGLLEHLVQYL